MDESMNYEDIRVDGRETSSRDGASGTHKTSQAYTALNNYYIRTSADAL